MAMESTNLSEEILQGLEADRDIQPPLQIYKRHIFQLSQLKKKTGSATHVVLRWLRKLIPTFPLEVTPQNLDSQWNRLFKDRKAKSRNGKLLIWGDEPYEPPVVHGPSVREKDQSATVSKVDFEAVQSVNIKMAKEIADLQQQSKVLLERPSPHKVSVDNRREQRHVNAIVLGRSENRKLEKENEKLHDQRDEIKLSEKRKSSQIERLHNKCARLEHQLNEKEDECDQRCDVISNELTEQKEVHKEVMEVNAIILSDLVESKSTKFELFDECGTFKPELTRCVWELLDCNVSQAMVPNVLQSVFRLAGLTCDRLPSPSAIRNMDKQRLLVSQKQVLEIQDKQNTSLQTDETPKYGEKYCAYIVDDEENNSYLLGMRHMADKSAQTTLDTFKEILSDMNDVCGTDDESPGQKILCNIASTMSDRAATEVKFNTLLEDYRKDFLSLYKDGYSDLTSEQKAVVSKLHNFFCGLHLLVGMADTVSAAFNKHEELHFGQCTSNGMEEDLFAECEKTKGESGILRLVRTTCKALSKGGDEKSGVYRNWRTYLEHQNLKKYTPLISNFKGNRFNIVFLLGGNVFFLSDHVVNCLHGIKNPNKLLRSVQKDIEIEYYLAGCKVLGLLQKLITSPLWRKTESEGHILEMNDTYKSLVDFLDKCSRDEEALLKFMGGESPFPEHLIEKDDVFDHIVRESDLDEQCAKILQPVMLALKVYLERSVKETLPGGIYWHASDDVINQTKAAPKHNKAPERVFGILDFLVHHRPNASTIVNEAYLMYCYNKTSAWVSQLPAAELKQLVSDVRKGRKDLELKFKSREAAISKSHLEKQQNASKALEATRRRKFEKKRDLTEVIIDAGLWQTAEVVEKKLEECDSDAERFRAITKQIRFRQEVLQQDPKNRKDVFVISRRDSAGKPKNKDFIELKDNLVYLINAAVAVTSSQTVSKCAQEKRTIPLLCGKKIRHAFGVEGGEKETFIGKVISQVPGFPSWFNVVYEGDDAVYSYRLVDDYKDGNLEIIVDF